MGWSEAVGPTGHVTTLEFAPEHAKLAEESFGKNGINNVEVIVGDARESYVFLPSFYITLLPSLSQEKRINNTNQQDQKPSPNPQRTLRLDLHRRR